LDWNGAKVTEWSSRLDQVAGATRQVTPFVRRVLEMFEGDLPFAPYDLGALVASIELLLASTPFDLLPLGRAGLDQEEPAVAVRAAAQEALELRNIRDSLSAEFALESVAPMDELRAHVTVVENAGLLSIPALDRDVPRGTCSRHVRLRASPSQPIQQAPLAQNGKWCVVLASCQFIL
jgi:hypothetical protein